MNRKTDYFIKHGTYVGYVEEGAPKQRPIRVFHERKESRVRRTSDIPVHRPKPTGLEYDLADLFLTQPWIHTYRGDRKPHPVIPVGQGASLLARLIRSRIDTEKIFAGWDDEKIKEVVEFAMKHFFDRVPNSDRGASRLINNFLGEDYWPGLIEQSYDHYRGERVTDEQRAASTKKWKEYYEKWPMKRTLNALDHPTNVKDALDQFNRVVAEYNARIEAETPVYDEPLTEADIEYGDDERLA